MKHVKNNKENDAFHNEKICQAKGIMDPFILRRLKSSVLKELPEKICEITLCEMSKRQRDEYDILLASYKELKNAYLAKNDSNKKSSTGKSSLSILACITELRVIILIFFFN